MTATAGNRMVNGLVSCVEQRHGSASFYFIVQQHASCRNNSLDLWFSDL